jgi:sugar lactone lactonase YvrE
MMFVILFVAIGSGIRPAHASHVYWVTSAAGGGELQRARATDGGDVTTITTTGVNVPHDITVDAAGELIFFIDDGDNNIYRLNSDGTDQSIIISASLANPKGLALDEVSATPMIYFSDTDTHKIKRAEFDGTNVVTVVDPGVDSGFGLALDVPNDFLYWTYASAGKVQRSALDGSGVTDLFTELGSANGLAIDLANQHLYWTDAPNGLIQRANADGTGSVTTILSGLTTPEWLELDTVHEQIYFTDNGTGELRRVDFDGNNLTTLVSGQGDIRGLAFAIPEPSTLTLTGLGLLSLLGCGRRRRRQESA